MPEDGQALFLSPSSLHTSGATQGSNMRDLIARQNKTAKEMGWLYVFQLLEKEPDEMGKLNT